MGTIINFNGVQHSPYLDIANFLRAVEGFYTNIPLIKPYLIPGNWYPRFFYYNPVDPYLQWAKQDGKLDWGPWNGANGEERMIELAQLAFGRYFFILNEKGEGNRFFHTREPYKEGEIITSFNMRDTNYTRRYIVDINEFLNITGISGRLLLNNYIKHEEDGRAKLEQYYQSISNHIIDVTENERIDNHIECIIKRFQFVPMKDNVIQLYR